MFNNFRIVYHKNLCENIISSSIDPVRSTPYYNFADCSSNASVKIADEIVKQLNFNTNIKRISGQTAGERFQTYTKEFIENCFNLLNHLRPGNWLYSTSNTTISNFDQYKHLSHLQELIRKDRELAPALGGDYLITPDIIVARYPVSEDEINQKQNLVDSTIASLTPFRSINNLQNLPTLNASISCKWTIRSDRSQNTRTEALNLIRNRKGHLPHIVAVTAEPLPTRIASLALGTGDLDCVYHFALYELQNALETIKNEDQLEMLNTLIQGKRLRDISDLPFDLAV